MNTPNISSVVSTDKIESRINQLKLMFLLLDRINFKSNWQSDDNSVFFIARARDVIIEEGHGFGNKVSVTLHNFESNLKLNITYVGHYTVPDVSDEPEHLQVELVSTFGKSIKFKATSCEEVYEFVQDNLNSILPTFVGVLTEDVVGMIKGKEYSFEKVIAHGQPVGYVKTKDESGNEVLVDSESFDMVVD